jgi:phage-related protein
MFWSKSFTYDGIPSANYSLLISSMDNSSNSVDTSSFPGDVKIYSEKLYRRTSEFYYGNSVEPMLEFPVKFTTDSNNLTAVDVEKIGKWLFARKNYATLKIIQDDISDVNYNCLLIKPQILRIGNLIRGIDCVVHCKDAWGLSNIKTYTYNFTSPASSVPVSHNNQSDYIGYTYPTLVITMADTGGDISIINSSDNSREFSFTGLLASEVLTIDNDLQIISSSTGLRRLSNFNKKFFRLKSGLNILSVTGAVDQIKVSYANAKKIGG